MDREHDAASAFLEALNSGRLDDVRACLAPDFQFEEAAGPGGPSEVAFLAEIQMFQQAFPDLAWRAVRVTPADGRLLVEFRGLGTQRGAFLDIPATGTFATFSGVFNLQLAGNRIAKLRQTVEFGGLRRQLLMAARLAGQVT